MAYHRFKDLTAEILERELRIQFHSAFEILRQFLPEMGKRKSGKVLVLLSSVTIGVPPKAMAHYVCAKYALLGLVRALASEYADRGVCVNAISPGMIDTRFLAELPDHLVEMVAAQSPRGRNARVNEVAPLVQWLLSDQAGFVSGANLPASGGGNF